MATIQADDLPYRIQEEQLVEDANSSTTEIEGLNLTISRRIYKDGKRQMTYSNGIMKTPNLKWLTRYRVLHNNTSCYTVCRKVIQQCYLLED